VASSWTPSANITSKRAPAGGVDRELDRAGHDLPEVDVHHGDAAGGRIDIERLSIAREVEPGGRHRLVVGLDLLDGVVDERAAGTGPQREIGRGALPIGEERDRSGKQRPVRMARWVLRAAEADVVDRQRLG
jgi:hypothetical protein